MSPAQQKSNTVLSVSMTETLNGLNQLEEKWRALEANTFGQMGVFQSFKWCKNCLEHWIDEHELKPIIISVFHDDELVSVWPMQQTTNAKVVILSWLGTPLIQYGSPLINSSYNTNDILNRVWAFISELPSIDMVRLHNVPETSPAHAFLESKCRSAGATRASILEVGKFADWDEYQASMKKSARRPRRKRYNKLSRQGVMKFEVHKSGRHFSELAKIAIDWKLKWLEMHNWPTNTMADPKFINFITSLGADNFGNQRQQPSHWVIGELSIDGVPIALEIGAVEKQHYYSFLGAYDVEWARYSPGKVQIELMIGWALEYGIEEFDFLCVAAQYKSDWTDKSIQVDHFTYPLSVRGRLFHSIWLKRLRPAAKYGLEKLSDNQRDKLLTVLGVKQKGGIEGQKHI